MTEKLKTANENIKKRIYVLFEPEISYTLINIVFLMLWGNSVFFFGSLPITLNSSQSKLRGKKNINLEEESLTI